MRADVWEVFWSPVYYSACTTQKLASEDKFETTFVSRNRSIPLEDPNVFFHDSRNNALLS